MTDPLLELFGESSGEEEGEERATSLPPEASCIYILYIFTLQLMIVVTYGLL